MSLEPDLPRMPAFCRSWVPLGPWLGYLASALGLRGPKLASRRGSPYSWAICSYLWPRWWFPWQLSEEALPFNLFGPTKHFVLSGMPIYLFLKHFRCLWRGHGRTGCSGPPLWIMAALCAFEYLTRSFPSFNYIIILSSSRTLSN